MSDMVAVIDSYIKKIQIGTENWDCAIAIINEYFAVTENPTREDADLLIFWCLEAKKETHDALNAFHVFAKAQWDLKYA